jgi:hypothetical protein
MQDQAIAERERRGVQHDSVGILNDRIAGDTPFFVLKNACAVLAGRLSIGLISVVPTGGGIREHGDLQRTQSNFRADGQLAAIDSFV